MPLQLRAIGGVEPFSTIAIKAQIEGLLTRVSFREGQDVKKGDLLFSIDPRPSEAMLRQAEANLTKDMAQAKQATANLARDQAQARQAAVEAQRYWELVQKNFVAREEYDQRRTAAEALQATVRADQAAVATAEATIQADRAAVERVRLQLEYSTIRSPIDGRTGSLMVHEGNLVKANDKDSVLVVINQLTPIYVTFAVPEQELPAVQRHLAAGQLSVEAAIPQSAEPPEQGVLSFVDNTVDRATGTIRLKATFANPDRRLWPGQFVNVVLTLAAQPDAIVVPSQAVQTGQNGTYVYVVRADRTAEVRPVVVARQMEGEAVIQQGLQPGETVVTDGQLRLTSGSQVEVKGSGPRAEETRP
jgi:multidrug efflux system membrane fusion protein